MVQSSPAACTAGAHEGRRLWRKQAVVSPMKPGVPQASLRAQRDDHAELRGAWTRNTSRRKIPFSRAKIASLQFPRPKIRRILAETGRGAHEGRRLWRKQAVVSPISKGVLLSSEAAKRLKPRGHRAKRSPQRRNTGPPKAARCEDAGRPLRIEDGSGGGARSARPVGRSFAARSARNRRSGSPMSKGDLQAVA